MDEFPKFFELYTPEEKGILATLDEFGVLRFAVEAGPTSSIRGTELFNRMMEFYGDDVRAIRGFWIKSARGLLSSNIDKVNELTSGGMSLEESILQTWTVIRAREWGFTKIQLDERPVGSPGAFTSLSVLLEKES
jgi:hypothetical protein